MVGGAMIALCLIPFLIIAGYAYQCLAVPTISYSSEGTWEISTNPGVECKQHFLCTPESHRIWTPKQKLVMYDHITGCRRLNELGIKVIYFHGDSYMRQIYAAMMVTLYGDYKYGSISNSTMVPYCSFHTQFSDIFC